MFKTIVLGLDGSGLSDRVIPVVQELAQKDGGQIEVVHVRELMVGRAGGYPAHPDEDELNRETAAEDRVALTGRAGTMLFCDTGGFHRGGFARTKPRVLYASTYVSPLSGRGHRFEVEREGRESELPAQALAALD